MSVRIESSGLVNVKHVVYVRVFVHVNLQFRHHVTRHCQSGIVAQAVHVQETTRVRRNININSPTQSKKRKCSTSSASASQTNEMYPSKASKSSAKPRESTSKPIPQSYS